ncbi:FAD-dependent oxidoreductase [Methyloligella sp. 2.7D]|uniref:dihydrolipoyl dehydrogenase family protein n=1 Tax=unclassified Methyloligella TaxID=2625955 RepID=UPI00157D8F69|nr:FAD-dependent oxidoreductase [Methyloligella sp. GL2]QKP78543.1 FAD-dependent oxidoreductase [Methyloligella sp. GL2]
MNEVLRPDLCVIGAGSGGLSVAAGAAAFGVSVVLIERGRMGGDCLNYGCVPSKALLSAAKLAEGMRQGSTFGISPNHPHVDFGRLHDYIHSVIADIAPNDSAARFTGLGVTVIQGEARFTNKRTVEAGEQIIKARRFIIATGSSPKVPEIPGLDTVPYLTNETIFDLTEKVSHLIVLGAGPVGLELGQAYRRLGAEVTIVDQGKPLAKSDPEAARVVIEALKGEGIAFHTAAKVENVALGARGLTVTVANTDDSQEITGSHLLVATGRKPNVEGLGLDKARIRHDETGIKVNRRLKTRNGRVYAIGDVTGPPQFTHMASHHAELVVKNALFRLRPKLDLSAVPRSLYTDPELAEIGLTESEARKQYGGRIRILRWPYADNDRAQAEHKTAGFIKVITSEKGSILGCVIVGADAGELIGLWILAIAKALKIGDIAGLILPYPTLSELAKRAAITYYQPLLRKPYLRRIAGFLRKFG